MIGRACDNPEITPLSMAKPTAGNNHQSMTLSLAGDKVVLKHQGQRFGSLTGDNIARELAGSGIGQENHAENKAVYRA
ncbi:hypothetical protein NIES1031_06915 [Chroogloeocystis siderophila 5.2 s.c.1]|jgi:hypothetical protein|uniref:Uncharacterized protein n=1 Tax=Chroogloeocystis siderophila 5.2 s.c.1 TaxID=247279 RepID=A0A1U7HVP6_9CHRO|nr:hypothetical protein NIES1031_06915 [Chroogloeocystis siderophila 5.2 s.c.1]